MVATCIRNCAWVVAWNRIAGRHEYLGGVDVVFTNNLISFIGKRCAGKMDREIDGSDLLVLPGLVNIHSHPSSEPGYKGIREEHGIPEMYMSGLYERLATFRLDDEGQHASAEVAFCEMLLSGVTTVADLSYAYPGWIDLLAKSGLRAYIAPWYASSSWYTENNHELKYRWDEQNGRRAFQEALALIDEAEAHPCGRLAGMLYPAQIDTCSLELLRDSLDAAIERGRPCTTHIAQSVVEFNVMVQRHGLTPVQWAAEQKLLGPSTILGHAIFLDEHSWLHWATRKDLSLLADSGSSVAHCPTPFARYGQLAEHVGRYIRSGLTIGIGTDTSPHNIIEEMRWAAILGRVAAENMFALTTEEVFDAATVGGAKALLRDDIGRLALGSKADLVLVDLRHPMMRPNRDPLRSLIYYAADRAVRDVYIDGIRVVGDGKVLTLDHAGASERLEEAQLRMLARVPAHDRARRTAERIAPLSLRVAGGS
jgi:cytosine/adenosine deaminase-related metal-dependent hydrolase